MNQKSLLLSGLVALLLMQFFSLKAQTQYTTDQPYMEIVSSENTGKWQLNLIIPSKDKKTAWIDLNDNGKYDQGEEKVPAYGQLFKPNRSSYKLRIYGKFTLFYCSLNNLTSVDVSHNESLEQLSCDQNNLTALDISQNPNLKKLYCNTNKIEGTLDCTHSPQLEELYCFDNKFRDIRLSGLAKLKELWCNRCQLETLDLTDCKALTQLICFTNEIKTITLSSAPNLQKVHCHDNRMSREAMEQMMQALPTHDQIAGEAFVIDSEAPSEENHCTDVAVQALSAKNWKVYDFKAGANGGYNPYAGESTQTTELFAIGSIRCTPLATTWRVQLPTRLVGQIIRIIDLNGTLHMQQPALGEYTELDRSGLAIGFYLLCVGDQVIKITNP